jgi:hypothetical protein
MTDQPLVYACDTHAGDEQNERNGPEKDQQ